jgi:hypothetical protein
MMSRLVTTGITRQEIRQDLVEFGGFVPKK